jgi:hypothetical protein
MCHYRALLGAASTPADHQYARASCTYRSFWSGDGTRSTALSCRIADDGTDAVPDTAGMTPDIAEALCVRVRELLPELDDAGFHITRFALLEARDRFSIGYEASVESIPDVLVDAVAAVTRTGVDFVYPGAIAIAWFTREHLESLGSRPTVSIEELLAARG